ncbi:hypothetical protein C3K47_10935 [Solitalea longa]|uniref:Uncharacterized protein n=1 Tax=Solitalea longa TaxID=2079460 RepID=A0A2S5A1X6_9SPHI|nr:hypothetical protein [Solitalea longa]POY36262.1 hypothetical protein C3K47_10935 [Solitalea longa]
MKTKRLCIYPKDVSMLTGKSERQAIRLLNKIRELLNKQKHQAVTIEEFAKYLGLDDENVRKNIFILFILVQHLLLRQSA